MKVVIQKVSKASVTIEGRIEAAIGTGLVVLVGIMDEDTKEDISWLSNKLCHLRIFEDQDNVLNKSVKDLDGDLLVVSQFTLFASTKKGHRPSYSKAAKPDTAIPIYNAFLTQLKLDLGKNISSGIFGANMKVELINDGPVTIIIDTKHKD